MMVFGLEVTVPKGEFVKVLSAGDSANLRLKSNRTFGWVHSVNEPNFSDCLSSPELIKKATIVSTPADVWACYSGNSVQIMTINKTTDAKFGE